MPFFFEARMFLLAFSLWALCFPLFSSAKDATQTSAAPSVTITANGEASQPFKSPFAEMPIPDVDSSAEHLSVEDRFMKIINSEFEKAKETELLDDEGNTGIEIQMENPLVFVPHSNKRVPKKSYKVLGAAIVAGPSAFFTHLILGQRLREHILDGGGSSTGFLSMLNRDPNLSDLPRLERFVRRQAVREIDNRWNFRMGPSTKSTDSLGVPWGLSGYPSSRPFDSDAPGFIGGGQNRFPLLGGGTNQKSVPFEEVQSKSPFVTDSAPPMKQADRGPQLTEVDFTPWSRDVGFHVPERGRGVVSDKWDVTDGGGSTSSDLFQQSKRMSRSMSFLPPAPLSESQASLFPEFKLSKLTPSLSAPGLALRGFGRLTNEGSTGTRSRMPEGKQGESKSTGDVEKSTFDVPSSKSSASNIEHKSRAVVLSESDEVLFAANEGKIKAASPPEQTQFPFDGPSNSSATTIVVRVPRSVFPSASSSSHSTLSTGLASSAAAESAAKPPEARKYRVSLESFFASLLPAPSLETQRSRLPSASSPLLAQETLPNGNGSIDITNGGHNGNAGNGHGRRRASEPLKLTLDIPHFAYEPPSVSLQGSQDPWFGVPRSGRSGLRDSNSVLVRGPSISTIVISGVVAAAIAAATVYMVGKRIRRKREGVFGAGCAAWELRSCTLAVDVQRAEVSKQLSEAFISGSLSASLNLASQEVHISYLRKASFLRNPFKAIFRKPVAVTETVTLPREVCFASAAAQQQHNTHHVLGYREHQLETKDGFKTVGLSFRFSPSRGWEAPLGGSAVGAPSASFSLQLANALQEQQHGLMLEGAPVVPGALTSPHAGKIVDFIKNPNDCMWHFHMPHTSEAAVRINISTQTLLVAPKGGIAMGGPWGGEPLEVPGVEEDTFIVDIPEECYVGEPSGVSWESWGAPQKGGDGEGVVVGVRGETTQETVFSMFKLPIATISEW